ncbi:envelope-like protein [Trifolium medium]|uniref:Envelope-like protein n=1 Tax=Trifolium medium TaxID=97028 RepID=A0A392Q8M2_9FABA|nr:envelope-like protein [Trifolium medium]
MPIAFPTLLCGIILSQHLGILVKDDIPCKRKSTLSLDYRLFEGAHSANIATPSVQQSSATLTRKQMIADLKDVSKALGEKKSKLDRVIQALELEEDAEVMKGEQEDKEDAAAGSSEDEQVEDSDESPTI